MYRCSIEIECDDFAGFHAVILGEADDVMHITGSYPCADDAENAARSWIDRHDHYPQSA
ncbi:MAG TPA: hypothetical protein VMG10_13045 [Gemmataceae bacterium]|nr:hypothetical protein [Gemmataceae bacterium]